MRKGPMMFLAAFAVFAGAAGAIMLALNTPSAEDSPAAVTVPEIPHGPTPPGMVWLPGAEFTMGSDNALARPEEKPAHRVRVTGFFIDKTEVTNTQFQAFVEATSYVTTAEQPPDLKAIMAELPPNTPPPPKEMLVPGALVFVAPANPVSLNDSSQWWSYKPGANWKHPEGPESSITARMNHPVVQVSWDDAVAYAVWAHKRLPTEAQWEYAARGGLNGTMFTWGDRPATPKDANYFQGHFPDHDTGADGFTSTAPVGSFPPNGFGLFDMAGNVWEWCSDWYDVSYYATQAKGIAENPAGPEKSHDPTQPYSPLRAVRGGSFLCADNYCFRYRPSARQGTSPDTGMVHTGFRCVMVSSESRL